MRGKRGAFRRWVRRVPVRKRVFVDESGTTTAMTRLYARAPAGERVRRVARRPEGEEPIG